MPVDRPGTPGGDEPSPRARIAWYERRETLLLVLIVLAGVLNNARSLRWGFLYDDYIHQMALRFPLHTDYLEPWDLFDFGPRPVPGSQPYAWGLFPWWTSDDYKIRFFRPVSSLSIALDYWLFDRWAAGYHLTSLLLFAAFLVLCHRLMAALELPAFGRLMGLLVIALEDAHFLPAGWIANRNTLLAAMFTVATVLCAIRFDRTRRWKWLMAAGGLFLLACGSKESGLVTVGLVGAYQLLLAKGGEPWSPRGGLRAVVRSPVVWLLGALAVGFVGYYLAADYGTHSSMYATPWHAPGRYLRGVGVLVPLGLLSLLFGVSCDLLQFRTEYIPLTLVIGLPVLGLVAVMVRRHAGSPRLLLFAAAWVVLSMLPEGGAELSDRLLMTAAVGTGMLTAMFLQGVGSWALAWRRRQFGRVVLAAVLALNVASGPVGNAVRNRMFTGLAMGDRDAILHADLAPDSGVPAHVFILNSRSSMLALSFLPTWKYAYGDHGRCISYLQMGRRPLRWHRDGERSMTLTSLGVPFLDHRYEKLFWTSIPPPGKVFHTVSFDATVLESDARGVRSVRLDFHEALDSAACRFLAWQDGGLRRIAPPAVGETIDLPEVPVIHALSP